MKRKQIALALVAMVLLQWLCPIAIARAELSTTAAVPYISDYKQIPGVTQEDIAAIDKLRASGTRFRYGAMYCSEAFELRDGTKQGFTVDLCAMLTDMLDIPFEVGFYNWDDLVAGLASGEVDFTGELTATPERREAYSMTDPIIDRTIKIFSLRNAPNMRTLSETRTLRFAVLDGVITGDQVVAVTDMPIRISYVSSYALAAEQLRGGIIDAFLEEAPAVYYFESYDFLKIEDFFPLIYSPVSLSTANPEYAPIIRVVQAYLEHGGIYHLAQLYSKSSYDYEKHKLSNTFTDEERQYIADHVQSGEPVRIAALPDNYPVSFYNDQDNAFQGISMDILSDISAYTGLKFEPVNTETTTPTLLKDMLAKGEAQIITGLMRDQTNTDRFLWTDRAFSQNQYALISTSSHADIEINQILYSRIGLIRDTPDATIYMQWFPNSQNTTYYNTSDEAFAALTRGEIDHIMASQNMLLSQMNYREEPGFKVNLAFDYHMAYNFAFSPDEHLLHGIINKAQDAIAMDTINQRWAHKMFDYRNRLLRDMIPILAGFSVVLALSLITLFMLHLKNKRLGKNLEQQVEERTHELADKTATITTVFSSIPDLIFCKDIHGRYTQSNKSLERYLNLKQSEIVGKTNAELFHDESASDFYTQIDAEVISTGVPKVIEETVHSPYLGTSRLFETIKTPLKQGDKIVGVMGIARDITERKAIEATAREASKAKSDFLARMSHEIRTPLNAIIGMTHITRSAIDDKPKALRSIDEITTASSHLLSILNDVLDMSKIESGKFEIADEPFSLNEAMSEVSSIIKQRCKEKYITFDTNIDDLPGTFLVGDKLRLNQVLINLLGNAVKFTPSDGTVRFFVMHYRIKENVMRLKFTVADTGIGMTSEQMQNLFTAFEQADNTIARRFGGTGLGLAISQNLVNLMGGEITVDSEMGKGSAFKFELELPVSDKTAGPDVTTDIDTLDFSGKRVLLAEDIEINRIILQELLSATGVMIDEAENGEEAIATFRDSPPNHYDLILMDIQMPIKDGYEATQQIRALDRPDARTVVILAMTANAYQEDINKALAVGMNGHLSKPIDLTVLMSTLNRVIGQRK